jgi:hypothetical protein
MSIKTASGGMIYIQSFRPIGIDIEAECYYLKNLRGCSAEITDGRYL